MIGMALGGKPWESASELNLLDRLVSILKTGQTLQPGGPVPGDPVQLQGLEFPTVTLCKELELPNVVASRISGRQDFEDATLLRVDLSQANLAFSIWSNCRFVNVRFDKTKFENGRFLGCTFEDCSFVESDFSDVGITLSRRGRESAFIRCRFEKASFGGAAISKVDFRQVEFKSCSMKGLRFDESFFEGTRFIGSYPELIFRGTMDDPARNKLGIDFSEAKLGWLDTNHGIDLSLVIPPNDGSLIVFKDRLRTAGIVFSRLAEELPFARKVADHFRQIFSGGGPFPLEVGQSTYALSKSRIAACDKALSKDQLSEILRKLRDIAREERSLV
jgi:uncharacterized protein YjbI with pentapeptide repeats